MAFPDLIPPKTCPNNPAAAIPIGIANGIGMTINFKVNKQI
jgi:hypothetical protein